MQRQGRVKVPRNPVHSESVSSALPPIEENWRTVYSPKGNAMLGWAIFFFLLAIVAAFFGFGGIAAVAVDIAKLLFVVFVVLFVLTLVVHLIRGRGPPAP
jgi:uncharacterized membrane protein YtjA (UPF0391 family)